MAETNEPDTRTLIAPSDGADPARGTADDRAHYLVVVEGTEVGRRIELGAKAVVIGRSAPADVVIADARISRNHCRVGLVMGEVFVTDLGSSNGTFVSDRRVSGRGIVAPGERLTIGSHVLEHEWRSRRDVEAMRDLDDDLEKAKRYVRSLLPEPLAAGPVRTDWVLQPCARLGGDAFGYHFIDEHTFAIYLLDVTGHGVDAAMHAVSVMNVLRQHPIPGIDVRDPARMAAHLNEMFQMDSHGGMLLTLWYGVCDLGSRVLDFASAGHHPGYLVGAERSAATPVDVSNTIIGMMPGLEYSSGRAEVAPGSSLYLFSDGVFEIEPASGAAWGMDEFVALLTERREPGKQESRRILEAVSARTGCDSFEDDFTLVVATFE